jgi:hypothetical protein
MRKYYPYPSDKPDKKFFIITNTNKRIYFGSAGNKDYTIYYKEYGKEIADKKKNAYIARHSKLNENWGRSGIDTPGFYAKWLLWNKPTLEASYNDLKKKIKN